MVVVKGRGEENTDGLMGPFDGLTKKTLVDLQKGVRKKNKELLR